MKRLYIYWIIIASLWLLIYLIECFILWEINNPFAFIINIPTNSIETRVGKLSIYIFYCLMMIPITSDLENYYNKNKKP